MQPEYQPILKTIPFYGTELALAGNIRRVQLPKGSVLRPPEHELEFAYLVQSGLVASAIKLRDGRSMTVRMQSRGDLLELDQLIGCPLRPVESTVLVHGFALRLPFHELQSALDNDRMLQRNLLRELGTRALRLEQISVCNRVHTLEQRLARHLLAIHSMVDVPAIPITQEILAGHLGAQRSSVVFAAGSLREKKLISFSRGAISISDPEGLAQVSCECHEVLRTLASPNPTRSESNTHVQVAQNVA